jgi:DNA-binding winged helix-turn-helix (wHTH) protein
MPAAGGFGFGPFRLDVRAKQLRRGEEPIALPPRYYDLLLEFVTHAGEVLTKDRLLDVGWPGVTVTENSLVKAITQLRAALDARVPEEYIRTESRRGYRFAAPVTRVDGPEIDVDVRALLAPHAALVDGRVALETLGRDRITHARAEFERLVRHDSRDPGAHIGLAHACAMQFEATRAEREPDVEAIRTAETHAREAVRLNPNSGEAWATLGFVLGRTDHRGDALAALRCATKMEPENWQHQLRLADGSWGEEKLRAARRTLELAGDSPLAHVFAATVFVARGALAEAERHVDAGLAAMPAGAPSSSSPARFPAVALHMINALLCLARGNEDDALAACARELALESHGHLYGRECAASSWYIVGAIERRRGNTEAARAAFEQSIARVPRHAMAHAGLARLDGQSVIAVFADAPLTVDIAMARAALLVAAGDVQAAATLVSDAIDAAPPGNAGWLLAIEPLLDVPSARELWAPALAKIRVRAL